MMKIGKDKWLHFTVCLFAAIISPWFAIGLSLGKEYGDHKAKGNHWCWYDVIADSIGTLIGTFIHLLIFCQFYGSKCTN